MANTVASLALLALLLGVMLVMPESPGARPRAELAALVFSGSLAVFLAGEIVFNEGKVIYWLVFAATIGLAVPNLEPRFRKRFELLSAEGRYRAAAGIFALVVIALGTAEILALARLPDWVGTAFEGVALVLLAVLWIYMAHRHYRVTRGRLLLGGACLTVGMPLVWLPVALDPNGTPTAITVAQFLGVVLALAGYLLLHYGPQHG
jgi:hypothetical protein